MARSFAERDGSVANIFVGCGGTGIETLIHLNGLLAQDCYWQTRVDTDIYYIVVDTESAQLEKFKQEVNEQLYGVPKKPFIRPLLLSRSYSTLTPPVRQFFVRPFVGGANPEGRDRLNAHWWSNSDGEPFEAPEVTPLSKGAGQCPLASFFLAWTCMPEIERLLDDFHRELQQRRSNLGEDNALAHNNLHIVAGVSGGTGRGCWETLAFKIRQYISHQGLAGISNPVGVFFDQSCYPDVLRNHPNQQRSMAVNSLTGFSELSCWISNVNRTSGKPYLYRLPKMQAPADTTADVLQPDTELGEKQAAPINTAFMVFGSNVSMSMNSSAQAYQMAGAALYARIGKSAVVGREINDTRPYNSVGTTTFEIEADKLRRYYAARARLETAQRLTASDQAAATKWVNQYLARTGFSWHLTGDDNSRYFADEKGDFLQRVLFALESSFLTQRQSLDEDLDNDSPEDVLDRVNELVIEDEQAVAKAVATAVASFEETTNAVLDDMAAELVTETRSIGTFTTAMDQLKTRYKGLLAAMPAAERMKLEPAMEPVAKVNELSGREYKVFGPHFNDGEKEEIRSAVTLGYLYANYPTIREQLAKLVRQLTRQIEAYIKNGRALNVCCSVITDTFDHELHSLDGSYNPDEPAAELFADPRYPEAALPDQFDPMKSTRRVLKPLEPEEVELTCEFNADLNECVQSTLTGPPIESGEIYDLQDLIDEMERGVRASVFLGHEFLVEHFRFEHVLERLARVWMKRFDGLQGSPSKLTAIGDQFEQFFGCRPLAEKRGHRLPQPAEMMQYMAASIARSCAPWWLVQPQVAATDVERSVMIFIPCNDAEGTFPDRIKKIAAELGDVQLDVITEEVRAAASGSATNMRNPFVMLAYAAEGLEQGEGDTQPLDHLQSLEYWQSQPEVKRWLTYCEDPGGKSVFLRAGGNKGLGYIDPSLVRNEQLAQLRWRPWWTPDVSELEEEINKTYDAILYALLTPPPEIAAQLQAFGWNLPLIVDAGRERYVFARKPYEMFSGKPQEATPAPWKAKEGICTSIWQVFDVLAGKGNTQGKKKEEGREWRDRILEERQLFWEQVAPQLGLTPKSYQGKQMLNSFLKQLGALAEAATKDDKGTWEHLAGRLHDRLQAAD